MRGKLYTPGYFEIYAGPMYASKSKELAHRLEILKFQSHIGSVLFKPDTDDRDAKELTKARYINDSLEAIVVPADNPSMIFSMNLPEIVTFDEMQFYGKDIVGVVKKLMKDNHHVLGAGLDLNFRGETFGYMGDLMAISSEVHKLIGVCESCRTNEGTRTQRLIEGLPAHYDAPIVSIEGKKQDETYEIRCLDCHDVPGSPLKDLIKQ